VINHMPSVTDWARASGRVQSASEPPNRAVDSISATRATVDSADSWGSTFAVAALVIALMFLGLAFA
jgi:hypothetical protein